MEFRSGERKKSSTRLEETSSTGARGPAGNIVSEESSGIAKLLWLAREGVFNSCEIFDFRRVSPLFSPKKMSELSSNFIKSEILISRGMGI